jgi:flagellar hook-length control protein FliK
MSSPLSELLPTPSTKAQMSSSRSKGVSGAGQGTDSSFRQSFEAETKTRSGADKAQQASDARGPNKANENTPLEENAAKDSTAANSEDGTSDATQEAGAETAPQSSVTTGDKAEGGEEASEQEQAGEAAESGLAIPLHAPVQPVQGQSATRGGLAGGAEFVPSQATATPLNSPRSPVGLAVGTGESLEQGQTFGNNGAALAAQLKPAEVAPGALVSGKLSEPQLTAQSAASQAGAVHTSLNLAGGLNKQLKLDGLPLNRLEAATFGALGTAADTVQASPNSHLSGAFNSTSLSTAAMPGDMAAPRMQVPISISFGQPQWATMVAERSAMLFSQNIHNAELILDPPELGRMSVQVQVHNNEQASVTFTSANPNVREALDQSSQRLRELLAEQGLDLVNVDVSDQRSSRDHEQAEPESGVLGGLDGVGEEDGAASGSLSVAVNLGIDHYV